MQVWISQSCIYLQTVTPQQLDPLALATSTLSPECLSCFTDGLRQNGLSGAGYVVYHHNIEWLSEAWPLGSYPTIFQAELDAIVILAVNLCKRNITNTEVIDHCDFKATIMSLEMATVRSKTVLSTKSAVSDLLSRNIVTIHWVLGHVNLHGNKGADELAKLGSTTPFIGAELALLLPQCSIVRSIWQRAAAAHARVWGTVQPGQFTYDLLPIPDKKLSSNQFSQESWNENGH